MRGLLYFLDRERSQIHSNQNIAYITISSDSQNLLLKTIPY